MLSFFSDICKLKYMEKHMNVSEFILLGLSYKHNIQIFYPDLFLLCYVALLAGKLISTQCSPLFHQRMCSFFSHLSFMDSSCMTPKLISDLLVGRKAISYGNCMWQLLTIHFSRSIEVSILTIMAFDHYVAIYKLHYILIMNRTRCYLLVLAAWPGGAVQSSTQFPRAIQLPFCGPNKIYHYFYDIFPLLKVSCTDSHFVGVLVVANSGL